MYKYYVVLDDQNIVREVKQVKDVIDRLDHIEISELDTTVIGKKREGKKFIEVSEKNICLPEELEYQDILAKDEPINKDVIRFIHLALGGR